MYYLYVINKKFIVLDKIADGIFLTCNENYELLYRKALNLNTIFNRDEEPTEVDYFDESDRFAQ